MKTRLVIIATVVSAIVFVISLEKYLTNPEGSCFFDATASNHAFKVFKDLGHNTYEVDYGYYPTDFSFEKYEKGDIVFVTSKAQFACELLDLKMKNL